MAIQFLPMPRPGDGVSSLLDFSPLAASLQNYTRGNDMATQRANMQQVGQTFADQGASAAGKQALSMGELDTGMQLTQQASADKDRMVKMIGAGAKAVIAESDPSRKAALWNAVLKRSGAKPEEFDPEELDPNQGPQMFMSMLGEDPLDRKLKEAQIQKALRPDSGPDAPNAVREYQFYQSLPEDQKRQYLAVKRAQQTLDLGTSYGIADPLNPGQLRGTVEKDLAGAEAEKVRGKSEEEKRQNFPRVQANYEMANMQDKYVVQDIDKALAQAGPWTTGFAGSVGKFVAGSPQSDLSFTLQSIEANLAFDKLEQIKAASPTGGALGQVTERELDLLRATWGSIQQAQSEDQFKYYLNRLKQIKSEYAVLRQRAYEQDLAKFGPDAVNGAGQNAQTPGGSSAGGQPQRAVNPQTGETVEWNGSAWVPVQ